MSRPCRKATHAPLLPTAAPEPLVGAQEPAHCVESPVKLPPLARRPSVPDSWSGRLAQARLLAEAAAQAERCAGLQLSGFPLVAANYNGCYLLDAAGPVRFTAVDRYLGAFYTSQTWLVIGPRCRW